MIEFLSSGIEQKEINLVKKKQKSLFLKNFYIPDGDLFKKIKFIKNKEELEEKTFKEVRLKI